MPFGMIKRRIDKRRAGVIHQDHQTNSGAPKNVQGIIALVQADRFTLNVLICNGVYPKLPCALPLLKGFPLRLFHCFQD